MTGPDFDLCLRGPSCVSQRGWGLRWCVVERLKGPAGTWTAGSKDERRRGRVPTAQHDHQCGQRPGSWRLLCVDDSAAESPSSGAYAVASVFSGDSRRIAHDWVAAWSIALEGHRAEAVTTAARLDAERKKERDERGEERLRSLAEQGKNRRTQKSDEGKGAAGDGKGGKQQPPPSKPKPTRQLVDPEGLNLKNEEGEIVGGASTDGTAPTKKSKGKPKGTPKDPDTNNPKKPSAEGGRGVKNYTDDERESIGLELVRRVLGGNEEQIADIRHQRNVGADAIDELMNFFQLKVYAAPIRRTFR